MSINREALEEALKDMIQHRRMPTSGSSITFSPDPNVGMYYGKEAEEKGVSGHNVGGIIDRLLRNVAASLASLTRIQVQDADLVKDITLAEDKVVITITPKNRYGKVLLEEVYEQYTQSELNKG